MRCTRSTTSTSASTSAGGRAAYAVEQGVAAQFAEHRAGLVLAERAARGRRCRAAPRRARRRGRPSPSGPKRLSWVTPTTISTPRSTIWQTRTPSSVDAFVAGDVGQLAVGVADLAGRGQADLDQAEFGLVGELRRGRLHDHRVADQARPPGRPPRRWCTSCSRGTRMPYARSSCFAACSLELLAGAQQSRCALRDRRGRGARGVVEGGAVARR